MNPTEPKKPRDDESFKEKLTEKLEKLKKDERVENLFSYAKGNTRDTIAYILLIIGIILLFFQPHYGGLIIGIISGLYFSNEIIYIAGHFNDLIEEQGMVRVLVISALLAGLFIMAPAIFLGAAIGAIAIKVIYPNK
jgi:ABC-type multidrug transport system fused ATPase/permease subunit